MSEDDFVAKPGSDSKHYRYHVFYIPAPFFALINITPLPCPPTTLTPFSTAPAIISATTRLKPYYDA